MKRRDVVMDWLRSTWGRTKPDAGMSWSEQANQPIEHWTPPKPVDCQHAGGHCACRRPYTEPTLRGPLVRSMDGMFHWGHAHVTIDGLDISDSVHTVTVNDLTPHAQSITWDETPPTTDTIRAILNEAADIYDARHPHYGDQWRKYGWRGALYSARRKVERAWAQLWDAPAEPVDHMSEGVNSTDDVLDAIVYLAMAVLEARQGNRDGHGEWWT